MIYINVLRYDISLFLFSFIGKHLKSQLLTNNIASSLNFLYINLTLVLGLRKTPDFDLNLTEPRVDANVYMIASVTGGRT